MSQIPPAHDEVYLFSPQNDSIFLADTHRELMKVPVTAKQSLHLTVHSGEIAWTLSLHRD